MAGKSILPPFYIITGGNMATTLTSLSVNQPWFDNLCVTAFFTGSPTGVFTVNVGPDNVNWAPLPLSPAPVASGGPGVIVMDLNQLAMPWLQVIYTPTSGSGTLNVTVAGKCV
jgi:hypothetical protein